MSKTPTTGRFHFVARGRGRMVPQGVSTRSPYGLEIVESCVTCPHTESRLFCNLPPAAMQRLSESPCRQTAMISGDNLAKRDLRRSFSLIRCVGLIY